MAVVVTGGLGFIGTEVVKLLRNRSIDVVMVDYIEERIGTYERHRMPILDDVYKNLAWCADALEPHEFIHEHLSVDAYIHLGACVDTRDVHRQLFERNVRFVRAFSDMIPYNAHVVFASSAAIYGHRSGSEWSGPCNPYGMTKQLGENILRQHSNLSLTALRFFNVFGSHEHHKGDMASVPFKIAQAYKNKVRFALFNPDSARDFVSVSDVAEAVVQHALEARRPVFRAFDVGYGEAVSFDDLDYSLRQVFGRNESCCDIVDQPKELVGRYQNFTRAGSGAPLSPYIKPRALRDALEEQFKP